MFHRCSVCGKVWAEGDIVPIKHCGTWITEVPTISINERMLEDKSDK